MAEREQLRRSAIIGRNVSGMKLADLMLDQAPKDKTPGTTAETSGNKPSQQVLPESGERQTSPERQPDQILTKRRRKSKFLPVLAVQTRAASKRETRQRELDEAATVNSGARMTSAEELPSGDDLDELEDGTREQSTQSGAEEEQSNLDELGDGTREQSTQSDAEVELNPDDEMPRSYPAGPDEDEGPQLEIPVSRQELITMQRKDQELVELFDGVPSDSHRVCW